MSAEDPFPHSRNRLDTAGRRIRHARRDGDPIPEEDQLVVEDFRRWYLPCVESIQGALRENFLSVIEVERSPVTVTARHKTPESIVAKLCRGSTALSRMQDIAGARIVVPGLESQEAAIKLATTVLGEWGPAVVDMRDAPTNYGYRAVHVIVERQLAGRKQFGEVQIRTRRQEVWAQMVERLDKDFGYDLKHGNGRSDWLEWLQDLSDELRKADFGEEAVFPPTPLDLEFLE